LGSITHYCHSTFNLSVDSAHFCAQEEVVQLHDMQRGRDRAIAADRYDVAVAAQVRFALCHSEALFPAPII
jgi:hypothetical protein